MNCLIKKWFYLWFPILLLFCKLCFTMKRTYCKVGSSRPVYYSISERFGQRSQYISIQFLLLKILKCAATNQDNLLPATLRYVKCTSHLHTNNQSASNCHQHYYIEFVIFEISMPVVNSAHSSRRFLKCQVSYSRVRNKRTPLNKHSPWNIWQKQ